LKSQQPGQFSGPQLLLTSHPPPEQMEPGPHAKHSSPPTPQARVLEPAWQLPLPSQQPGQFWGPQLVVVVHDPLLQNAPGGHAVHAAPPVPHEPEEPPPWH
jgi:hypothetical protein